MSEEILEPTSPAVEESTQNQVPAADASLATEEPAAAEAPLASDVPAAVEAPIAEEAELPEESFGEAFAEFERAHSRTAEGGGDGGPRQIEATVVTLDAESVVLDIGFKSEGVLARTTFPNDAEDVKPGDRMLVTVRGRNPEGYYELSRIRVAQPTDWTR